MTKPRIGEGGPTDSSMVSGHEKQHKLLDDAPGGSKSGPQFDTSPVGETRAENAFFSLPHRPRRFGRPNAADWDAAEDFYRDFSMESLRWSEERLKAKDAYDDWDEMDLVVIRSEIKLRGG